MKIDSTHNKLDNLRLKVEKILVYFFEFYRWVEIRKTF